MRKQQKEAVKQLLATGYAIPVTAMIGKWAFHTAYLERGYEAVGGEYLLIPMVFFIAYKAFEFFINTLEEEVYGSNEERGRRDFGMRNYRE